MPNPNVPPYRDAPGRRGAQTLTVPYLRGLCVRAADRRHIGDTSIAAGPKVTVAPFVQPAYVYTGTRRSSPARMGASAEIWAAAPGAPSHGEVHQSGSGAGPRHPRPKLGKFRVDLFAAPHVVSSCELPQDRKVARVSGLWQVHGGSLIFPGECFVTAPGAGVKTVSANR